MRARVVGVLIVLLAGIAHAQTPSAQKPPERFTVTSDRHPMAVWARRPAAPKGAILLIHGRTWSSRPDFDLQVPGLQRSVMTSFEGQGFAAYAVDLRGYGETPRDKSGWLTPKRSVADVVNVLGWIAQQHPSLPKPTVVGWSRGALIGALAAQQHPDRVSNLVMFGMAYDPTLEFVEPDGAPGEPARFKNSEAGAASDFISPLVTPPAVIKAFVTQAMRADPVLVDLKDDAEFNAFVPADLKTPTLMIYGSEDPGIVPEEAGLMFALIGAADKQLVVLPGADHAAQLENTHNAWIAAIVNFINRPGTGLTNAWLRPVPMEDP